MRHVSLVLDIDETIITTRAGITHNDADADGHDYFSLDDGLLVIIRPGFFEFLRDILPLVDRLYIFTAATEDYARAITNVLFKKFRFDGFLTREHCSIVENSICKNLSRFRAADGHILDNVLTYVIDDCASVTRQNVNVRDQNHYVIPPFRGDINDRHLSKALSAFETWQCAMSGCRSTA